MAKATTSATFKFSPEPGFYDELRKLFNDKPIDIEPGMKMTEASPLETTESLRQIVNKGIDRYDIDGKSIYYDLEFCRQRLHELERADRLRRLMDWVPGRPKFPIRTMQYVLGVLCMIAFAAFPIASSYLWQFGPSWIRGSGSPSLEVAYFLSSVLTGILILGAGMWLFVIADQSRATTDRNQQPRH